MEIMLGNRARITRSRVAERATGLLASPSSCPGLPCISPGLQPGVCAMDWNPSRLEWLTHQQVERLKLTLPLIYTYGRFWLGMYLFWLTEMGLFLRQARLLQFSLFSAWREQHGFPKQKQAVKKHCLQSGRKHHHAFDVNWCCGRKSYPALWSLSSVTPSRKQRAEHLSFCW